MRGLLIWGIVLFQLVLVFFLARIVFRLALLTFFYRPVLPYVPLKQEYINLMIQSGALKNAKSIADLGCGDGVIIARLKKVYPHTQFYGVELARSLALAAKVRFVFSRKTVHIQQGDLFGFSLRDMDAVAGWWTPDVGQRLVDKLVSECRPGCVIVAAMFRLPEHPKMQMKELRNGQSKAKEAIFIYTILK